VGKVIHSTTMTVDAVIEVAGWFVSEGEHDRAAREQFEHGQAMLLGRKTYEGLAAYWSPLTGEWADLLNPLPKYVASRTLDAPLDWNATLIEGDVVDGVSRLKHELGEDLVLIGCGELARHLLAHGLVDEVRFWVHPVVWGQGERLSVETTRLELLGSSSYDSGVTLLRYRPLAGE
jgi:dihydrofolate reductase